MSLFGFILLHLHETICFILILYVLVQVKRKDKGLQPTLMDIRGSESIVKDADTIIFLLEQLREENETEIIVAKHRAYI